MIESLAQNEKQFKILSIRKAQNISSLNFQMVSKFHFRMKLELRVLELMPQDTFVQQKIMIYAAKCSDFERFKYVLKHYFRKSDLNKKMFFAKQLINRNHLTEAEYCMTQMNIQSPGQPEILKILGDFYLFQKHYQKSLSYFKSIPNSLSYLLNADFNIKVIQIERQCNKFRLDRYEQQFKLSTTGNNKFLLGLTECKRNKLKEGIMHIIEAISLQPLERLYYHELQDYVMKLDEMRDVKEVINFVRKFEGRKHFDISMLDNVVEVLQEKRQELLMLNSQQLRKQLLVEH